MTTKKILVTGATGFVGKRLCRYLLERNYFVRMAVRNQEKALQLYNEFQKDFAHQFNIAIIDDIDEKTNWSQAVSNIDAVVHLAARAHVLEESSADPLAEYRRINVLGTMSLATAANDAGVKRFIYLSSIGVNGTSNVNAFTEKSEPKPVELYAVSKLESEQSLIKLTQETSLETIIIRPPMIYGKNAKGNFYRLVELISKGIPLPLALGNNQRSFIYIENLCGAILTTIERQEIKNNLYLVSDDEIVTTSNFIRMLAKAKGTRGFFIPCPKSLLYFAAKLLGKTAMLDRLYGSLVIDNSKIKNELGWQPQYTMQEALKKEFGK